MQREELPSIVLEKLETLEKEFHERLSVLRLYKGKYYVYSYNSVKDKESGKSTYRVNYKGRITSGGEFESRKAHAEESVVVGENLPIKVNSTLAELRKQHTSVAVIPNAGAYHVYDTSFGVMPAYIGYIEQNGAFHPTDNHGPVEIQYTSEETRPVTSRSDMMLLKALSMNARMPLKRMGSFAGMGATAAFHRIKKLGSEFGIRYLAELDLDAMGYSEYICFIKFAEKMPSVEEITGVFSEEPSVQLVAMLSGEYDVMAYILARSNDEIATIIYNLRRSILKAYKAEWNVVPFKAFYGYIPLRDEFFDIIEEKSVWRRSKEEPRLPKEMIPYNEYVTLRELNTNGASEFSEIDRRYGLGKGASVYAYHILQEKYKYLKRITITMHKPPVRYNALMVANFLEYEKFINTRDNLMYNIIEDGELVNKYLLEGDLQAPYAGLFIATVQGSASLDSIKRGLERNVKGIEVKASVITDVVVGRFCYRVFDNMYSRQALALEHKGIKLGKKIEY
ncbi:MAG: Lrp/AsnC family transcriptional regulator [Candidatus Marsarchaeota archaeon]|nr:Lrp/AsnC family transcriptional regulator [Candidatus Marsarchaeota archaeon]